MAIRMYSWRAARRAGVTMLVTAGLAASAACSTPGDAQEVISQGRVVDGMASSIDEGTTRSYTATYQLDGGETVTVVHTPDPYRDAFLFPGGRYVSTPEFEMTCKGGGCTLIDPLASNAPLDTDAIGEVGGANFLPAQTILGLLTKAALDTGASIEQSDATLVGEHASCAQVSGLSNTDSDAFEACVTNRGVVGRFTGTVDGTAVNMLLVSYVENAENAHFDVPPEAKVDDRRKDVKKK
ncbi:hypothetical protein AB0I28_16890 [Phytomonospora sp. NPDC050363]|uniref:hypothetical protein n=1 Tax=Phytomonospora sp. NPDC050363 TaxID=3155642 RepID=UPI0033C13B68